MQDFENLDNENRDTKIIDSRDIRFKNLTSHLLVYNFTSHGIKFKEMDIIVKNGDRSYAISYISEGTKYDKYKDTINSMIRKLQLFAPSILAPSEEMVKVDLMTAHSLKMMF
jgi:hypothetical protein